jgi:Zn-dependent M28 family amino/carboxypeptidase
MKLSHYLATALTVALLINCSGGSKVDSALESITVSSIEHHIRVLADDSMMGRAPATRGEEMAVEYIISQFEKIGIQPGMPDGGWIQNVPVMGQRTNRNTTLQITRGGRQVHNFAFGNEMIVSPAQDQLSVDIRNAEMVYVGHGIIAPEENWDDYKGLDVSGKILIMKNSDPASYPDKFAGDARLYYGRWTYKYEIAQELGALGVLIIHTTPTAGYPWSVVANSFGRERFSLIPDGDERTPTQIQGWLSSRSSLELFTSAGLDLQALMDAAESQDFTPVSLGNLRASISLTAENRYMNAKNVVGMLPGNDPILRDEYLVFSAHHDHLGVMAPVDGDSIANGALDNASGVSAMLNLANAYKMVQPELKRSILFVAVGAEESGLLGSLYFARNPTVDPAFMAGNINLDGMNIFGIAEDIVSIGYGRSSLDDILKEEAVKLGRVVRPDQFPEQGFFYRSDHFSFARIGVPAIFTMHGTNFIDKPDDYGRTVVEEYNRLRYHTVFDEFDDTWDLNGAVEDTRLLFRVGFRVANAPQMQTWTPGNEFEGIRLRSLESRSAQ